jgi:hypothetical protein
MAPEVMENGRTLPAAALLVACEAREPAASVASVYRELPMEVTFPPAEVAPFSTMVNADPPMATCEMWLAHGIATKLQVRTSYGGESAGSSRGCMPETRSDVTANGRSNRSCGR